MTDFDALKKRFEKSTFRSRFRLDEKDRAFIARKGWAEIDAQARKIVRERLAPAFPKNDGRQTPMRGHVVFIAQHATGTCCRGCLRKWHGIPPGRALTPQEIERVAGVISAWLRDRAGDLPALPPPDPTLPGF